MFHVTYDIVTPESAERGDTADIGFVGPRGFHYSVEGVTGDAAADLKAACAMTLRAALQLVCPQENNGDGSFYENDGRQDYRTGAVETRALHAPRNITQAGVARLARLFNL